MSSLELVTGLLKEKNVPMSVRSISHNLHMKKRAVLAICHEVPELSYVHPSWCGSGRTKGSVFVYSSKTKWLDIKPAYGAIVPVQHVEHTVEETS